MAKVFVSHASKDRELADEVHGWLTGDGHEVFLDHHPDGGIAVGEAWEQRLYERLRWADAVVCLVTSRLPGLAVVRGRGRRRPVARQPAAAVAGRAGRGVPAAGVEPVRRPCQ